MNDSVLPWAFLVGIVGMGYAGLSMRDSKYPMSLTKSTVDGDMYLVRNLEIA
jgi:hypothetical protein